jgi:hypothetical protein
MATEKQLVHDWSTGSLQVYEIDAEAVEPNEPPATEPAKSIEP